ncbi:MAG: hypothetical protein Q8R55_07095 [Candidatus Taylorbacteria bacterium]|nr:hypothetical protein [Candidatus Taylorbacteria bacterium]
MIRMLDESGVTCIHCKLGQIITRVIKLSQPSFWERKLWGKSEPVVKETITHCNACGIIYAFVPGQEIKAPEISESMVQIQPGSLQGKPGSLERYQTAMKTFMEKEGIKLKNTADQATFEKLIRGTVKLINLEAQKEKI